MYVFHYDATTLAYTGNSPVDFCQLEPGRALVPAWATMVPPPGGWDSRTHLPYYMPATDAWEVRALPRPAAVEASPQDAVAASVPVPLVTTELLQASLQAHLDAAALVMEQLKKGAV